MWLDLEQLKNFLVDTGLVSKKELDGFTEQAKDAGRSFEEVLLASGKISEDELRRAKAYVLGIPFVDLRRERIEQETLFLIPEPVARKHNIVAFRKSDKGLEVAMLDPADLEAISFIKKSVGAKILPRLTDTESIKSVLLRYQKSLKDEFGDIIREEASKLKTLSEEEAATTNEQDLKRLAEDLPVVRIVETLISHAVTQKASDIHIETFESEVVIRYRIDGILHDAMVLPKNASSGLAARIKVLANLRLDEKRLPQDGRFKLDLNGQRTSFRVSVMPTHYGEKIVMRLLPESSQAITLEEIGFHGESLERVHRATRQTTGMILATGPTGSGKTTTLYAILEILNTPDVNIVTIEDPIEYQLPRVNQTQVKPEIGLTFGTGLRSIVRQDPDIVMVGEIRDKETTGLAINAALTGHLVLSTLHTNSAAGAIPRLLDMGAEPFLVVSTVNVVIAQRLIRRLTKSREKYFLTEAELKKLGQSVDLNRVLELLHEERALPPEQKDWLKIPFYRPRASEEAPDGYLGRSGIQEVLQLSSALKEAVMSGATDDVIAARAKKEGMYSMVEDGLFKAVQGITSLEEVLRVINE